MSVQAITWALSVRAGSPSAKCVLLALANYANESGVCWPSQERLADETDQSVDSVQRRLKDLDEVAGLISRQERGLRKGTRAVTVYTLMMPGVRVSAPQDTTPQSAAPQMEGSDTALLRRHEPIEPSIDDDEDARARPTSAKMMISKIAQQVAIEIGQEAGYATPQDWPTGWLGAPMRVQGFLDGGYAPEVIKLGAITALRKKRDGPPENFAYFDKPIATAKGRVEEPLPIVRIRKQQSVEVSNVVPRSQGHVGNSVLEVARRHRESLENGANQPADRDIIVSLPAR